MPTLPDIVPNFADLWVFQPEELAGIVLRVLKEPNNRQNADMCSLGGLIDHCVDDSRSRGSAYPRESMQKIYVPLAEAWSWLEAQGLLVPSDVRNGPNGYRRLSRRAREMANDQDFHNFVYARHLPRERLHPTIQSVVWGAFVRGEYDVAVFQAMKAVEVAVRDASGLPDTLIGVNLMHAAFKDESGPLTDTSSDPGEKSARRLLFAGAIGSYKNPHSHRDVQLVDPIEAIEIVLLANHLLRIVDARKAAIVESGY